MDAFETLDQAHEEIYCLLSEVRDILERPLSARGRAALAARIDRKLQQLLGRDSTLSRAHAMYSEEKSAQISTPPAQSALWPAPVSTMYARPADVLAPQHRETAPGECSACGRVASGQQLGGARKNGKTFVRCKGCGAQVAI